MRKTIIYILLLLFLSIPINSYIYAQQGVRPSYQNNFYSFQRGGIPDNPGLWKGLIFCVSTSLGITGIGTDSIKDISGRGNSGTPQGSMTGSDWVVKEHGYVLELDNSDDYIQIADVPLFDFTDGNDLPYSLSGWFYLKDITETVGLISKFAGNPNAAWLMYCSSSALRIEQYVSDASGNIGRQGPLVVGSHQDQLIHIAATYDGSETNGGFKLFVNGLRFDTAVSAFGSYTGVSPSAANVQIGAFNSSSLLNGFLGDVLIHNRELAPNEVMQLATDPGALFRLKQRVFRPPAAAPAAETTQGIIIANNLNRFINTHLSFLYN